MTQINNPFFVLDENYATTRRVTQLRPIITCEPEDKIQTQLFLPATDTRKGEGGLRSRDYFKISSENKPLITVITVVFNGENYLEQSILSVIEQDYDNVEYIIIDGGSTDGTLDIIRRHENQIDYWISESDKGVYDAFNKGVQCASGDWICFLGCDDYFWDPQSLFLMLPSLIANYQLAKLVYGNMAVINKDDHLFYINGEPWDIAKAKLGYGMAVPHPGLMHHKSWFLKYGLFDCSYKIAGDYEMLLRGQREQVVYIPEIIVGMRQGGISSNPHNTIKSLHEMRLAQKKNGMKFLEWRFIAAFLRVYIRLMLQTVLGEKITYYLLDIGRLILGRKSHWTKL